MIESALGILASVLWLASGLGLLAGVVLLILPSCYSYWVTTKHAVDMECELYNKVVEALDDVNYEAGSVDIRIRKPNE